MDDVGWNPFPWLFSFWRPPISWFVAPSSISKPVAQFLQIAPSPSVSHLCLCLYHSSFTFTLLFLFDKYLCDYIGLDRKSKIISPSQDSKTNHICRVPFAMYINIFTVPRHFGRLVFTLNNSRKEVNN